MKAHPLLVFCLGLSLSTSADNATNANYATAEANQELPNILYVVPWKEAKRKFSSNPKLVLHNLMGDLYEPQLASDWQ